MNKTSDEIKSLIPRRTKTFAVVNQKGGVLCR